MNSVLEGINCISVAINHKIAECVQSATDRKVQAVALRVLATVCTISATALIAASLSGRVSMPEGLAISAALLVIAYGLILGAQHLEHIPEIDLELDEFLEPDARPIETSVTDPREEDEFFDAPVFNDRVIFGNYDFKSAIDRLSSSEPYCFFREGELGRGIGLVYRTNNGSYKRDHDIAKNALEGVDLSSLLNDDNLQTFKDRLHQRVLALIEEPNAF